jgi:ketosteroid isomerase-like protein
VPVGKTNSGRDRIVRGLTREFENFYSKDALKLDVLVTFRDDTFAGGLRSLRTRVRGPYGHNYSIVARFEDGKLIEGWEYMDSASVAAQLT